jgi:hypothetical protein
MTDITETYFYRKIISCSSTDSSILHCMAIPKNFPT